MRCDQADRTARFFLRVQSIWKLISAIWPLMFTALVPLVRCCFGPRRASNRQRHHRRTSGNSRTRKSCRPTGRGAAPFDRDRRIA
jgi:hypothetical protein